MNRRDSLPAEGYESKLVSLWASTEPDAPTNPITFGGVFALTKEATRGVLWDYIAVVNRPGVPLVVDRDCPRGRIYFINVDTTYSVDSRTGVRKTLAESLADNPNHCTVGDE